MPNFADIARFLNEARSGKWQIFYSTISLAEFRSDHFAGSPYGGIREFFEDMGSACIPIDPTPNIMIGVSELRSAQSVNPGRPGKESRVISTPDAIVMMSAIFARDAMGVEDIILHTTDEGKGVNWAGRCIPILGFEDWYPEAIRTDRVKQVCSLAREKPIHPEPLLEGIVHYADFDAKRRS